MKKIKSVLTAFVCLLALQSFAAAQFGKSNYVALYRLYSSQSLDHIYTTNCGEKDQLLRDGSYVYEGVAGYMAASQERRTTPLYRMLLSSGEHFYTIDENELKTLAQDYANKSEGIVGYVATGNNRNTLPFYRLISGDRHLYTTNEQEKNDFLRNSNGQLEKLSGYLWTSGSDNCDYSTTPVAGNYPTIYAGTNFDGAAEAVERDWSNYKNWDGSPNTIRSIRVPRGWYLVLYTGKNFRGKSYNVNSDITFSSRDQWYNRIRSIRVYQGNPPPQPR